MGEVIDELIKGYGDLKRVLRREFNAEGAARLAQLWFVQEIRYWQWHEIFAPASLMFNISKLRQIDAASKKKRAPEESIGASGANVDKMFVCDLTPERLEAGRQRIDQLSIALDKLAPRCREAFVLCKLHGRSYKEAAREMGICTTVVQKYLVQAIRECRSVLLENNERR